MISTEENLPAEEGHLARTLLMGLLAVVFGGPVPFIIHFASHQFLYLFYLAVIVCVVLCVVARRQSLERVQTVMPYLAWLALFLAWGTFFSRHPSNVIPDVNRCLLRNFLLVGAVAMALTNVKGLGKAARLFQVMAMINFGIAVYEVVRPELIEEIAFTADPDATAFDVDRPAGLWSNPNEAAFAYLFALLLSHWDRGPVAWAGRLACVGGILLTGWRSGMYLLVLWGLVQLVTLLVSLDWRRAALLIIGLPVVLAVCVVVMVNLPQPNLEDRQSLFAGRAWISGKATCAGKTRAMAWRPRPPSLRLERALAGSWHLLFSERTPRPVFGSGAHNIYLAVLGESGIVGFAGYLAVLFYGCYRAWKANVSRNDWVALMLLWLSYLFIGFVWHNQLTSLIGMVMVGVLYQLPGSLERQAKAAWMTNLRGEYALQ